MQLRTKASFMTQFLACLLIVVLAVPFYGQSDIKDEALKYKVSVNVMTVPIFAVDTKGNPIYDLKEEDIELKVNDKPVQLLLFKRYELSGEEKVATDKKSIDRVIFIILDTMFNSLTGFRRSQDIATNLIEKASPGDSFVILENNTVGGLKYVGGAESTHAQLIKKIKKLKTVPEKWSKDTHADEVDHKTTREYISTSSASESRGGRDLAKDVIDSERFRYQHQVKYFSKVLSQFKYALKTIKKPKIVFLISEGVATGAFQAALKSNTQSRRGVYGEGDGEGEGDAQKREAFSSMLTKGELNVFDKSKVFSSFLFGYLMDIVKSINEGGSVLYTVNPKKTDQSHMDANSGDMSLRVMASDSGGKHFAGADAVKLVEKIKKTTAAYYEVFFTFRPEMGENVELKVTSKRPGIHLHTLNHSERQVPYTRMKKLQKQIFAHNVATGGSWSRMVGKVMKIKYKKLKPTRTKKGKIETLHILLPKVMQNKTLELFIITVDPKTQKTDVAVRSGRVTNDMKLQFKKKKKRDQFFVIIEPQGPHCIYNKIK